MNQHVMMRILSWQMTPRHTHFSVNIPLGAGHGLGLARISGMRLLSPFLPIPWTSWVPSGGFSPALEEGARQGAGAVSSIPGGGLCLQLPVPGGSACGSSLVVPSPVPWQVALPTRPNAPAGTASTLFSPFPLSHVCCKFLGPKILRESAGNQAGIKWCLK